MILSFIIIQLRDFWKWLNIFTWCQSTSTTGFPAIEMHELRKSDTMSFSFPFITPIKLIPASLQENYFALVLKAIEVQTKVINCFYPLKSASFRYIPLIHIFCTIPCILSAWRDTQNALVCNSQEWFLQTSYKIRDNPHIHNLFICQISVGHET